jgi:hypothetical protein
VQLAGQPGPLGHQRQLAAVLEQAGVVDGDGRVAGQQHDRRLVGGGELVAGLLVRQVEGADDVALRHDRHAEEGPHAGVRRRPPAEAGVGGDVVGAVRLGRGEHGGQQAVGAGERADPLDQLVAHADGDEGGELVARRFGQADRGVAGTGQVPGARRQLVQHPVERRLRGDRAHGGTECGQHRLRGPVGVVVCIAHQVVHATVAGTPAAGRAHVRAPGPEVASRPLRPGGTSPVAAPV